MCAMQILIKNFWETAHSETETEKQTCKKGSEPKKQNQPKQCVDETVCTLLHKEKRVLGV